MTTLARKLPDIDRAWRSVAGIGLAGGVVAIYLALVGIVPVFNRQSLVTGVITLGGAAVFLTPVVSGYLATRRASNRTQILIFATLGGALTGLLVTLLVILGPALNLRQFSQHATASTWQLLTLGTSDEIWGVLVPTFMGAVMGLAAGLIALLPAPVRRSFLVAGLGVAVLGLFAGVLRTPMLASPLAWAGRELFAVAGLSLYGAIVTLSGALGAGIGGAIGERRLGYRRGGSIGGILGGAGLAFLGGQILATLTRPELRAAEGLALGALVGGVIGIVAGGYLGALLHRKAHQSKVDERVGALPTGQRRLVLAPFFVIALLFVIALPHALGPFFAQVVALVVLYMMMSYGLNITLGMAGLLDLGFVAFFAIGAYTVGILTSAGPLGLDLAPFNQPGGWWFAVPFAVLGAFLFGAFLGLPVLGIRGDYLAIATLGFGEIIRIMVGSAVLQPITGGPQGMTLIPRPIPVAPDHILAGPTQIYYIALVGAAIIAFLSYRLRDSRLGRAWLAIREDEDVAEALGINLVQTKLLAYSLGAAFAGLGGAVFAGLVGSIFNTSINLLVSINVAAIIIIGGMGSIPGVALGAIFLIGLPELFREFSEYRFLFYGAVLILLMRFRPEGLLPSRVVKRELHVEDNVEPVDAPAGSAVAEQSQAEAGAGR
ncbi:MAG TPA: branched-chain amino acid ABC transporter permease [Candidatus Limnocylindria bacterium]|nr:branched-chain amino acid ABC transporter permease [Candidatus Limnocylindria bacterium]